MPKRSSRGASRPTGTRTASPPPRQTHSRNTPAVAQSKTPANHAPPAKQPPPQNNNTHTPTAQPPVQQVSSGGSGIMGTIFASAAGSAIGHVVGRTVMNAMGGGGSEAAPVGETYEEPQQQEQYDNNQMNDQMNNYNNNYNNERCSFESRSFQTCLSANNNDISPCQWAFDILKECQRNSKYA